MDGEPEVAWDDLELDELSELLELEGVAISPEQTQELAQLLKSAGGIEDALLALSQLPSDSA